MLTKVRTFITRRFRSLPCFIFRFLSFRKDRSRGSDVAKRSGRKGHPEKGYVGQAAIPPGRRSGCVTRTTLRGQRRATTINGATLRLIRALCPMRYRQKIWQPGPASRIVDPSVPLTSHESLLTCSTRLTLLRAGPLTRNSVVLFRR